MAKEAEELDETSRALVAAYWWRRAEGELTSWVGFRHVLEDLRAEESPAPVLALAERAVNDEYQHSLWCRDWARRFGFQGTDELRPRGEEPITFRGASESENIPNTGNCSDDCRTAYQGSDYSDGYACDSSASGSILCGCAWVYLQ